MDEQQNGTIDALHQEVGSVTSQGLFARQWYARKLPCGESRVVTVEPFFPLGVLVVTAPVVECISLRQIGDCVDKHQFCDWGDVTASQWDDSARAFARDRAVVSRWQSTWGRRFRVCTIGSRRVTFVSAESWDSTE